MKKLKKHIDERLEVKALCTVFQSDFNHIWPRPVDSERMEKIRKFAEENNYSVKILDPGIRVIFRKLD